MAVGRAWGELAQPGDVVVLSGWLGSGKTVLAKGIAWGLGIDPNEVQSPTFTLVREYDGRLPLYHLDVYRLENVTSDLEGMGYEDYFYPDEAVSVIEWGDLAEQLLPSQRWEVTIEQLGADDGDSADAGRRLTWVAVGLDDERIEAARQGLGRYDGAK